MFDPWMCILVQNKIIKITNNFDNTSGYGTGLSKHVWEALHKTLQPESLTLSRVT